MPVVYAAWWMMLTSGAESADLKVVTPAVIRRRPSSPSTLGIKQRIILPSSTVFARSGYMLIDNLSVLGGSSARMKCRTCSVGQKNKATRGDGAALLPAEGLVEAN